MKKQCTHKYVATAKKGSWNVKIRTTNSRGKDREETVSTTFFKCTKCGAIKEYPDTWEKNYVANDQQLKDKQSSNRL